MSDSGRLSVLIRPELYTDHQAIRSLTARAFDGMPWSDGSEPRVIDLLRQADALACSLVALAGERVGRQLIEAGLANLRERGASGCVLLGDHGYYSRFRFRVAPALAPPGYPAEHFQVLPFGESLPKMRVGFHAAFTAGSVDEQ